jgi:hypothetical protein
MGLTTEQKTKFLTAIETDSLVFLCGAGLSMADPTFLPTAIQVARICYDKWNPVEPLDPAIRDDIDKLAGHFHDKGDFEKVFISKLVPWDDLVGQPNKGHAAISDLLLTGAAHAALSANFDPMIELWAAERKIAMQGALTGHEAVTFAAVSSPLLKFHGCLQRDRARTLWTARQLAEASTHDRIESCSKWINLNLPGKDLIVVGFWTDWGYLNGVLAEAFTIENAHSVTVINPDTEINLRGKAPDLWDKLKTLSKNFEHIEQSGADILDEIRTEYSRMWVKRFYKLGVDFAAGTPQPPTAIPDGVCCDDLYDLRRDAEGIPYTRAARWKAPEENCAEAAHAHISLLRAGATKRKSWLEHGGRSVRVVNGAGKNLDKVKESYKEPSSLIPACVVICAGAKRLGVPAKLISTGAGPKVLRPGAGGTSDWLTYEEAERELGL